MIAKILLCAVVGENFRLSVREEQPAKMDTVLLNGNLIGEVAVEHLRDFGLNMAGAASTLTPEQLAVAEAEAELDAAQAEGRIVDWYSGSFPGGHWHYDTRTSDISTPVLVHRGDTRLEAAKAAVKFVRGLESPKPKLPDLGSMDPRALNDELGERGCSYVWSQEKTFTPEIHRNDRLVSYLNWEHGDFIPFLRRALAEVRKQDGVE